MKEWKACFLKHWKPKRQILTSPEPIPISNSQIVNIQVEFRAFVNVSRLFGKWFQDSFMSSFSCPIFSKSGGDLFFHLLIVDQSWAEMPSAIATHVFFYLWTVWWLWFLSRNVLCQGTLYNVFLFLLFYMVPSFRMMLVFFRCLQKLGIVDDQKP